MNGLAKLNKRLDIIKAQYPEKAMDMVVKLLYDIKLLAQQKLKVDEHIDTSRLRNSLFVKSKRQGDTSSYSDREGRLFSRDLDVQLSDMEGAVGTDVDYAAKIEYQYDSYLYWGAKNVDVNRRAKELSQELSKTTP